MCCKRIDWKFYYKKRLPIEDNLFLLSKAKSQDWILFLCYVDASEFTQFLVLKNHDVHGLNLPAHSLPIQKFAKLQSHLLLYIHIYRQGITYPCSPRAASWQGRALSWTPRGPASVRRPPQLVQRTPAEKPAYAYWHTYIRLMRYYLILCSAFLCEHRTKHQGLLSMR